MSAQPPAPQPPGKTNTTAAYPSPMYQRATSQSQPWNNAPAQHQHQQRQWVPPQRKGKGGGKRGKPRGACWTCKQFGHIAANCPNYCPAAEQYVGSTRINVVVGTLKRAIDSYDSGGTAEMSSAQLDHQMAGEESEGAVDILHVAGELVRQMTGAPFTASTCQWTNCRS